MGTDKAMLPWPDRPLWEVQLEKLSALGPAMLMVAGREDQGWKGSDCPHPFPRPQAGEGNRVITQQNATPNEDFHITTALQTPPPCSPSPAKREPERSAGSQPQAARRASEARQRERGEGKGSQPPPHFLPDPPNENAGPLPAIIRCLEHSQMRTLILAVDMPDMTTEFLHYLVRHSDSETGVCCQLDEDRVEPLAAVFTPAMLPHLKAEAQGKGSVHVALNRAISAGTCSTLMLDPTSTPFFRNVNTPEDLVGDEPLGSDLTTSVIRLRKGTEPTTVDDDIAVEEPLEIRVEGRSVAVVMRTPGNDEELAAGFLVSEGVVKSARDILEISQCPHTGNMKGNVVDVLLGGAVVNWDSLTRHVFSASSCGLCGKTSLDSVLQRFPPVTSHCTASANLISSLPDKLRAAQDTFEKTGGLHACAIFDLNGNLIALREDVGRHNALDKILGFGLRRGLLPWSNHILLLSGRVSFEMMQKALAAGVPIVAAISAPTSLAVDFARDSGQTLIGFLRGETMNVYAGASRVTA